MKNRFLFGVIFLYGTTLLFSCKGVHDIRFTGADGFVLKDIENNKVNFTATIGVNNPSTVSFKISEVNLKTSIDDNYIGTLTTFDRIKIPSRSDSSYQMMFSLELSNIMTGVSTLYSLSRKKQVTVDMQGYVKARSWFTSRKVEIKESHLIDVPSFNR